MDEHNPRLAPGVRAYDVRIPSMTNNYFQGVNLDSDDDTLPSQRDNLQNALANHQRLEYLHDRILMEMQHWNPDDMTWHEQPEAPEIAKTDMLYEESETSEVRLFK